jgi:hypothetical protein
MAFLRWHWNKNSVVTTVGSPPTETPDVAAPQVVDNTGLDPKLPDEDAILPDATSEPEVESEDYERQKFLAFERVNSLTRRYNRREEEWVRSEDRYLEAIHLYTLAYGQLVVQKTPGLFAGELPSHDERAFDEWVEAAEALIEEIDNYAYQYDAHLDTEYEALMALRDDKMIVVETATFPGSGSKMEDARKAMELPEFAEAKARADVHIKEFATSSVMNIGGSVTSWASEFFGSEEFKKIRDSLLK